jgi:hypothetical protein
MDENTMRAKSLNGCVLVWRMHMKDKSSENYLDNLLDSITDIEPSSKKRKNGFRDIFLDNDSDTETDDDFLRSFEEELESDSYKDYLTAFERELEQEQGGELEIPTDTSGIPDDIGAILKGIEDNSVEAEAIPGMPEPMISGPEEILSEEGIVKVDDAEPKRTEWTTDGVLGEDGVVDFSEPEREQVPGVSELKMTDAGEVDLSGGDGDDLMKMLANSGEFEDIGEMLSDGSTAAPEGGLDEFEKFAMEQMDQRAAAAGESVPDSDGNEGDQKAKKKKEKDKKKKDAPKGEKQGFAEKFKRILFGEDEDEELAASGGMSAENAEILKEIDEEEKAKKAKKEKKKKAKKEKPAKPKKAPKPKKPPKPKKEKPPKEKDNTPPLPKGPVIMIVVMVASLAALVILGTKLLNYSSAVTQAKVSYNAQNYTEAYKMLQGESIQKKDLELYNQLSVLAAVSSEYDSFLVFRDAGKEDVALDSLICAAGRYDLNLESAAEYGCQEELDGLRTKIESALSDGYGISMDEAIDMYNQRNRTEYTVLLHRKLIELGLE